MKLSIPLIKFVWLVVVLTLFNCSKSSTPAPLVPSLVGTWSFINTVYSNCTNPAGNYTDASVSATITFTATTFVISQSGGSGTYTITGSIITFSGNPSPTPLTVNVTGGNILTFTSKDPQTGCTVVSSWKKV